MFMDDIHLPMYRKSGAQTMMQGVGVREVKVHQKPCHIYIYIGLTNVPREEFPGWEGVSLSLVC